MTYGNSVLPDSLTLFIATDMGEPILFIFLSVPILPMASVFGDPTGPPVNPSKPLRNELNETVCG